MRIPEYIKPGDTIAFSAPSCSCASEPARSMMHDARDVLIKRGYKVIIGKTCYLEDGKGIATDPYDAAKELMDFYLDDNIKAIIAAGGGELMCETISHVDFRKLKRAKPKWFVGISDNTNMIFTLATLCNTAAIYGPVVPDFRLPLTRREEDTLGIMEGKIKKVYGYEKFASPEKGYLYLADHEKYHLDTPKILHNYLPVKGSMQEVQNMPINMKGMLLGGCLDVLANLCGTRFDEVKKFVRYKKIIWVLEACDLNPMGIRRAIWELDEAGWFKNTAGFVIGRPLAARQMEIMGVNQYNAVYEPLEKYGVPIIMDADIGHINPNMPLVIGAYASVSAYNNTIEVNMKC
ncbi:LD-carboxypeptidase [Sharpea azabuensis]|uniref:LD-carboxypeptidase n=1 Tax=Sharpea azabuensis TaxID=322505 RepID=UPI0013DC59DA|nr:LD-carboxypeptidase [Sharpea azabuensis]